MSRRNNIQSNQYNTNVGAHVFIDMQNQNEVQYVHHISEKFQERLRTLEQINSKLVSRINQMAVREKSFHDIYIKYLALKDKVLETEEKLLLNGIDTSEYSAFDKEEQEDSDVEIIEDTKFEVLLECELNTENTIPVNKFTQNYVSMCFTQEQLIPGTLDSNRNN